MTVVVKLGSSIVAADDGGLREDVLDAVCAQVAELHGGGENVVMVTSGAIARGIRLLALPRRPAAIDELQAASAVGQGGLYRAYERRLEQGGVRAAQVLLTASDLQLRTHYLNARGTLRRLLEWRAAPVVNENDTTATDEITFGDNDFLAAQVAIMLEARLLVLLTDTDGLHTADPRLDPSAELVPEVRSEAELERYEIGENTSAFGLGGMRSKVAAAAMAGAAGIETVICDGTAPGSLLAAAGGEATGTRFQPHPERASSFKLWLRYAKPAHGTIRVDEGAARVLREQGTSLLPVGVTEVEGDFAAGDAVEVTADGSVIGKGIANYSAEELRRIKGMRSAQVRELLPHASEEAVHRDYFVLDLRAFARVIARSGRWGRRPEMRFDRAAGRRPPWSSASRSCWPRPRLRSPAGEGPPPAAPSSHRRASSPRARPAPTGTHSTTGGFVVTPPGVPGAGFRSVTQISNRLGHRGWSVTSGAESTNPPATLTAAVRCEKPRDSRPAVRVVSPPITIPHATAQTINFMCPRGTRPVGAGWSVDNPFDGDVTTSSNLIVVQSRRLNKRTWRLTGEVRNDGTLRSPIRLLRPSPEPCPASRTRGAG